MYVMIYLYRGSKNKMEKQWLGEKTISDGISLEILTSGLKLPPLPANGTKLLDMAQQHMDNIDITVFTKLIEMDPGLLSRVLQLANSPYYSGVVNIISLKDAITRIGLEEAINSVCFYFFQKTLPKLPVIEGFSSKDSWAYSWTCAVANRRLGHPNLGMGTKPGELYLTGLLHGIGKLLMAIHYPKEFSLCLTKAKYLKQPLHKLELDIFGTTDAFVSSKLMEIWNLPENTCKGVAFYQMPEDAPKEYKEIAGLTQLAYRIAAISGIGISGDGVQTDLSSSYICQQANLQISKKEIRENLVKEILTSLNKKSESVTGLSSSAKTSVKKDIKSRRSDPSPNASKKKKGLFAKIMSLFNR